MSNQTLGSNDEPKASAKYPVSEDEKMRLRRAFFYEKPTMEQANRIYIARQVAAELSMAISSTCPNSREKSLALTKLEEAVMWANESILRNE